MELIKCMLICVIAVGCVDIAASQREIMDNEKNETIVSCLPNPCENNGNCSMENYKVRCDCVGPYIGEFCAIAPCLPNPCKNNGNCNVENGKVRCDCVGPYIGEFCETASCLPNPCKNNGNCSVENNKVRCACVEPFFGEFCATAPCLPSPCKNNGTCSVENGEEICDCVEPYIGKLCATDLRYVIIMTLLAAPPAIMLLLLVCFVAIRSNCLDFNAVPKNIKIVQEKAINGEIYDSHMDTEPYIRDSKHMEDHPPHGKITW